MLIQQRAVTGDGSFKEKDGGSPFALIFKRSCSSPLVETCFSADFLIKHFLESQFYH